ncbi:galactokinase [Nocardioides sp.]|uniref:galactokinase n=1 Tax=Nocardioides sp. TaxID=35761 RepID=UPI0031FEB089|nr:galactokinase [Nocardioides sp.]
MAFVSPGVPADLVHAVRASFRSAYGRPADVVGRAPGRVNLIGEHTDYNAGLCLPVALPHATCAAVARRDDDRVRIASRQEPRMWEGDLASSGPGHPTEWASYAAGVLWALREAGHAVPGLDIYVDGTVPLGAGLSSSAALECSVAVAVAKLVGLEPSDDVRRELAAACVRAETEVAGAPTGGMDQTVSLLARTDCALLIDFDEHSTRQIELDLEPAGLVLLVTDTRVTHSLNDGGYAARRADCEHAVARLGVASLRQADLVDVEGLADERVRRRARHVVSEIARVELAVRAIEDADWARVGDLFEQSHASMRDDFEISCPELDAAVETAVEAGAVGARMTGGGFGGSSVAVVPQERVEAVARAIDARFAAQGFRAPAHLRAVPSAPAGICAD